MDFFATRVLPWRHDIAKYLLCHINTTPILRQPWVFVWDLLRLGKPDGDEVRQGQCLT